MQSLRQAKAQAGTFLNGMAPKQRWMLGGAVLALVGGMALFLHLMSAPPGAVLYSGLDPADAQQVATQLGVIGVPYTMSPDNTSISVPANELDKARLQMAARGLPHSGQLGFEIFDKTNWSGSDFAEQVNYQRALEGELERTIETIHGVQGARIHITMAHDSLFTSEEREAKAAVLLTLGAGRLDPDMVGAIQHLVASSVDHLTPRNVSVMDANGELALSGEGQAQTKIEADLAAKIVATLAPVVGAQHVRASVDVAYDPTSADDTQETYDPNGSVVTSSQHSSSGGASEAAAGVPGTTSNLPAAQAPGTNFKAQLGLSGGNGQQSDTETYAVSRTFNHVVRPAGTLQRMTAAVLVDDASQTLIQAGKRVTTHTPRTPQEMQQYESLAAAAIGLNAARGDVLTVTNLPFITTPTGTAPEAAPAAPAGPRSWEERLPSWWQYAALGFCVMLLCGFYFMKSGARKRIPAAVARHAAQQQLPATDALATTVTSEAPEVAHEILNMTELLEADPEGTPPEVQQVLKLKERVADRVKREPAIASRLVQGWMNKRREDMQ